MKTSTVHIVVQEFTLGAMIESVWTTRRQAQAAIRHYKEEGRNVRPPIRYRIVSRVVDALVKPS